MASFKPCEEPQNSEDTASVRAEWNQPTTSKNMLNFGKFSQTNARDTKVRFVDADLVSECSISTSLKCPESFEDSLKSFSTQKAGKESKDRLCEDFSDGTSINSLRPVKNGNSNASLLMSLSRSPVKCPVTSCPNTIGITSVLSHFLRDHQIKFHADMQEVTAERRSILKFDEGNFTKFNENVCLGLLIYAGKSMSEDARPGIVGLCRTNAFLPQKYSQLVNHLPIFILGCKTSMTSMLKNRELAKELTDLNDRYQDLIVIWLATVETVKPLHCTINAFNSENWTSRSKLTEVRGLKQPQEPHNFMAREFNYLGLTRGDINCLSENPRKEINLEIYIHEYE